MNALVQSNAIISRELSAVEMENLNGEGCAWSIFGYGITLASSIVGAAGTGGLGAIVGVAATAKAGYEMLDSCLWS
jgi:hypothetical protein